MEMGTGTGTGPDLPDQRDPFGQQVKKTWKSYPLLVIAIGALWLVLAVLLIVAAFVVADVKSSKTDVDDFTKEQVERRSQICTTFESQYRQEVEQVSQTYAYLLTVQQFHPDELKSGLNRFVIGQLPQNEAKAKTDTDTNGVFVPQFCDEPGNGLLEPDPKPPHRPAALNRILK